MSLHDPSAATETAPDTFAVLFDTTKGPITLDVERALAPIGVDRFYNLVRVGFYDDVAFFRVVPGFVAQFGLNGDPAVNKLWRDSRIKDDPATGSNTEGTVTFATSGKDSRTTQIFINLRNNARLDAMGFSAFATVREMDTVRTLNDGYGESPRQGQIVREGNAYLRANFPELDFVKTARVR